MKLRKILTVLFLLCLVLGAMTLGVSAETVANGVCGDDITWTLDEDGTLILSGTGDMWDYKWGDTIGEEEQAPWYRKRFSIKKIVVGEGITGIGSSAFCYSESLKEVALPDGLKTIGNSAFYDCCSLKSIEIPADVVRIDNIAFYDCWNLQAVIFTGSAPEIAERAFLRIGPTVYYPNDGSWTEEIMQDYDGKLTWVQISAPVISTQPKTSYIKMGAEVVMPVVAAGAGLRYQWYEKEADETQFRMCDNTTDTYRAVMSEAVKDRMVRCVITDALGNSVNSHQVTMRLAATVTEQPVDTYVRNGEDAVLKLKAVGDSLKYTWYHASADSENFTKSTTFTGDTYSVKMDASRDGRRVYCVVKDRYGKTHKSDIVTIRMIKAPVITVQPKTNYTKLGSRANVTVQAEGEGLSYQWYFKNTGAARYSKSSVKTAAYSVQMSDKVKDRMVYCVVTNRHGVSVKTKTASLRLAATITRQPVSAGAAMGKKITVRVRAAGDGLRYQWYYKNSGSTKFVKSGITAAAYSTTMHAKADGRQLYCVVKDKYGKTVTSDTVTIGLPPEIIKQPASGYAANGQTVRVSLKADGDGLTYQWYYKNAGQANYSKSSVTSAVYSTTMDRTRRNRKVYCVIKDMYGNTVQTKTVELRMAASITVQPKDTIAANGDKASVKVSALGDGLTYCWYYKNAGEKNFSKSSQKTAVYTCVMGVKANGQQVYCVIRDKYGNTVTTDTSACFLE